MHSKRVISAIYSVAAVCGSAVMAQADNKPQPPLTVKDYPSHCKTGTSYLQTCLNHYWAVQLLKRNEPGDAEVALKLLAEPTPSAADVPAKPASQSLK